MVVLDMAEARARRGSHNQYASCPVCSRFYNTVASNGVAVKTACSRRCSGLLRYRNGKSVQALSHRRDEDLREGWIRDGRSQIEEISEPCRSAGAGVASPAVARAWLEEMPPVTEFKSGWWRGNQPAEYELQIALAA
jgi:hypothetical protein